MTELDRALDEIADFIFDEFDDYICVTRNEYSIPDEYLRAMRAQIRMEIARILYRHGVLK
jgi:hypothetical protein